MTKKNIRNELEMILNTRLQRYAEALDKYGDGSYFANMEKDEAFGILYSMSILGVLKEWEFDGINKNIHHCL